jgi:hypothetical protein
MRLCTFGKNESTRLAKSMRGEIGEKKKRAELKNPPSVSNT